MITVIQNGRLVLPHGIVEQPLYLEDGKIIAIGGDRPYDEAIDAQQNLVAPGFVDIHTHGANGHDFMDGTVEAVLEAAKMHLKHGTTTIFPTAMTSSVATIRDSLEAMREAMKQSPQIAGAHLEGPYFSLAQCGAQNTKYITPPQEEDYLSLLHDFPDVIRRWSFAPELPGGEKFCETLLNHGVIPAVGHSDATYDDVEKVYSMGCNLITHLYSGMSTITRVGGFRRLGVVESAYLLDMTCEIIADGKHLPPELLRLIFKQKGREQLCLITDSLRVAGMPEGPAIAGNLVDQCPCIVEDGVAKLPDRSAFAGSVATADRLVRVMVQEAGVSLVDAVYMMATVPARTMKLWTKGKLEVGYDADIVLFDDEIQIKRVMLQGKSI